MTPAQTALAAHPILKYFTAKNVVYVALAISAWHYKDVGDVKDLKGDVLTLHQQNNDQEKRLDIQREANKNKIDKETYDRDVRDLRDGQNRLQNSIDNLTRIVIDTRDVARR